MKRKLPRLVPVLLAALAAAVPARADIVQNTLSGLGGQILSNPTGLFFDWQQDAESITPLPPGKWIGFDYHLGQFFPLGPTLGLPPMTGVMIPIPLPDPTTAGNISGKLRLHAEGRWAPGVPQIDLIGGAWNFLPSNSIVDRNATASDPNTKLTDATLKGKYYGLVLTSSLEPRVRLFWGYKYSSMDANVSLNRPFHLLGADIQNLSATFNDHFLFAGLEHPTTKGHYWTVAMSYGVNSKLLAGKVAWSGHFWDIGLNFYPEGIGLYPFPGIPIHPTIGMHLNF